MNPKINNNPKPPVYWTMASGEKVNVDNMSCQHVRNTLKLVLRNIEAYNENVRKTKKAKTDFALKGDMANEFNNSFPGDDTFEEEGDTYLFHLLREGK